MTTERLLEHVQFGPKQINLCPNVLGQCITCVEGKAVQDSARRDFGDNKGLHPIRDLPQDDGAGFCFHLPLFGSAKWRVDDGVRARWFVFVPHNRR